MLEGQFYGRLLLNLIVGILFIVAMNRMACHNSCETVPQRHVALKVLGWICMVFAALFAAAFVYFLTKVQFPSEMVVPYLDPSGIIRSSAQRVIWGYPTVTQNTVLTELLATCDAIGFALYFLRFRSSCSSIWKKIMKFMTVLFLYVFMASASNFHYFDIWEFVPAALFLLLWVLIMTRQEKPATPPAYVPEPAPEPVPAEEPEPVSDPEPDPEPEPVEEPIAEAATPAPDGLMYCRHCGKLIEADSKFCKHCGRNLGTSRPTMASLISRLKALPRPHLPKFNFSFRINKPKLLKWLKIIGISALIIGALIGIGFLIYYYFDVVKPEHDAEAIYREEVSRLNEMEGDELLARCRAIVIDDDFPKVNKYWLNENNRESLHRLAWEKIEELSDSGNVPATVTFAYGLLNGSDYLEQDWERAAYLYLQAAKKGNARAQNNLAVCYRDGLGVYQNIETALYWFRKSAEQGNGNGELNLGDLFRDGISVENGTEWRKDPDCYYCQYEHRCERHTYPTYREVLKADVDSAMYWWSRADAHGIPAAKRRLQKIY